MLGRLQKLGVTGVELRWFTDYLSGRMQRVKQNHRYSDWGLVLGGIPQGSALGPLLFLIYVNEMPSQVRHGCLLQFADDTCLICAGNSPGVVARLLQDDLSVLSNWVALSKMKLNFDKSNVMWFNVKRLATSPPPILHIKTRVNLTHTLRKMKLCVKILINIHNLWKRNVYNTYFLP